MLAAAASRRGRRRADDADRLGRRPSRAPGEFADLKVTVSQTKDLINQVVKVSWTGGTPTVPGVGSFAANYLQIMQCWGDPAVGPTPRAVPVRRLAALGDTRGGNWVTRGR